MANCRPLSSNAAMIGNGHRGRIADTKLGIMPAPYVVGEVITGNDAHRLLAFGKRRSDG
jgi:hypothetical protein